MTVHEVRQTGKQNVLQAAAPRQASSLAARATIDDRRPQALLQRKLGDMINSSARVVNQRAACDAIMAGAPAQRKASHGGLPAALKNGIEQLSGKSMDDVKVHRNSSEPARLQAHAYAQGSDIHLGPGQERHLPHEAWHVAQQKQGRVKPNRQLRGKIAINDDAGLEKEADRMGAKAMQMHGAPVAAPSYGVSGGAVAQRVTYEGALYEPGDAARQTAFLSKAEEDLTALGKWVPSRSERLMRQLGLSTLVIADAGALAAQELGSQRVDVAVDADISGIKPALEKIAALVLALADALPALQADGTGTDAIEGDLAKLVMAGNDLPDKMRLKQGALIGKLAVATRKWMAERLWEQKTVEQLNVAQADELAAVKEDPDKSEKKRAKDVKDRTTAINNAYKKKHTALGTNAALIKQVFDYVAELTGVDKKVPDALRASAQDQFVRGQVAYRYDADGRAPGLKKIYIGQIADTEATKNTPKKPKGGGETDKARGVLWATPWSPGVNVGFIEGGLVAGNVFKLRTAIPDDLAPHLAAGDIDQFKTVVHGQMDKKYWPFWQGQRHEFTLFSQELEMLVKRGYRLRKIEQDHSKVQQVMATEAQFVELKKYYDNKPAK